jgi:hypothetical protein
VPAAEGAVGGFVEGLAHGRDLSVSAALGKGSHAALFYPDKIDPLQRLGYSAPMDKQARREMLRDYKEKKTVPGVYAVRCGPTGECWVAASRNIDAQQNSVWFGLRTGGHPNKAMQAAWMAHGEAGFGFEALERIEAEELTPLGLADLVKSRERHWVAALGAMKAVG